MVIYFMEKRVREFLLENGFVYTLRIKRKKFGRDWMTDKRGNPKICDVNVELWGVLSKEDLDWKLAQYVKWSGFSTVTEWKERFLKRHKLKKVPDEILLLRVVVV